MPLFGPPNVDRLKEKKDVRKLIKALGYRDPSVRRSAAEALGEIGDAGAVEALSAALQDEDKGVRGRSAYALGRIGDHRALEPLQAALKDDDASVRTLARNSLAKLQKKAAKAKAPEPEPRAQPVQAAAPELVAGHVLAMAIVYEGHVIEEPDPVAIANELLTAFSEVGILTGVTLHPHSGITIRRADESAWYRGDYEPDDELPQMLNEGIGMLRDRLLAAGQTMGKVNVRTVQLKGRSRVVSTCWVGIHILQ
ncbi:MAG: HEAT repeat domain-containing protein [Anaerolineae bacterium]|jgi:hypothetical protein